MSEQCFINIKLNAKYEYPNIHKILSTGELLGFEYHDHICAQMYDNSPIINALEATDKVLSALQNQTDDGPCVYTVLNCGSTIMLWFYKYGTDGLNLYVGDFGGDYKKKDGYVDLGYYIPIVLKLCEDFVILNVEAKYIGEQHSEG